MGHRKPPKIPKVGVEKGVHLVGGSRTELDAQKTGGVARGACQGKL